MEFYSEKWVIAKKEHKCACCEKVLKIGEKYSRQVGKFDGDFFSRALCVTCREMLNDYCNDVDNEFSWDSIIEYAREQVCYKCESYENCDLRITGCEIVKEHYKREE